MNPLSWYRENDIRLHAGVKATHIDRERRVVVGMPLQEGCAGLQRRCSSRSQRGRAIEEPYDDVIIATGSRPFVPPMEGFGGAGTFLFRTIDDCARIADCAQEQPPRRGHRRRTARAGSRARASDPWR